MQAPLDPGGGEAAGSQKRCFGLCENGVDFGSMVWLWGEKGGIYRHQMWAHFMKILLPGCRCRRRIRRRRNDEKMLWNLQMEQP